MDGIQVNSSHFFEKSMLSIAFHLLLMAAYTIGGPFLPLISAAIGR